MSQRITAGELSQKCLADTTKYQALEVGHAMADDLDKHFDACLEKHLNYVDQEGNYPFRMLDEFCVVMVIAKDNLIKNVIRRKFYCCPFLPSPRPNQVVFWYKKAAGRMIRRLWALPSDMVMAELASMQIVHKRYQTMQAWSVAFLKENSGNMYVMKVELQCYLKKNIFYSIEKNWSKRDVRSLILVTPSPLILTKSTSKRS